jgi:hypothetical protein
METNVNSSVQDEQSGAQLPGNTPDDSRVSTFAGNSNEKESAAVEKTDVPVPSVHEIEDEVENEDPDNIEEHLSEHGSFDYSPLSKHELVEKLIELMANHDVDDVRFDIESIKSNFYKRHKAEVDQKRKDFVDNGGNEEDFAFDDPEELRLKDLLKLYRERKAELNKRLESEKEENYKAKLEIIEKIKELTNGTESVNDTYHVFGELQKKWRSTGLVPQQYLNDLWENYNLQVERFYDYIKINKELRDLDLKRNLEAKIKLCEDAEALMLEPSVVNAFRALQDLHLKWRETGPASRENRTELWNRFKEATASINKRHQEYFENLKHQQKTNYDQKVVLCEKAEELANVDCTSYREWDEKSKELVELQTIWKTIGFAPKKDNNKIYARFRTACDEFFNKKREFFARAKDEQMNNLQIKTDLCIQAEALAESTEWKKSTDELLSIQKKWKEVGPVPRKYSDSLWKRFRAACDTFFNNKSNFYSGLDNRYEDNLQKKLALIVEIEGYTMLDDVEANFSNLKDFQRRWSEIGFIPLNKKEETQLRYKKALDKLYDALRIDDGKRKMLRFKSKVEQITHGQQRGKINVERDKLITRLKKLEGDIAVWENNIGFFAHSKNAEAMIRDVQRNIDSAREEIRLLEDKINLIDNMDRE